MAAYSPKYSTATIVKERLGDLDSRITDAYINEYLRSAEGLVETVMRRNDFTFDEDKHGLIRQVTTDLAAYYVILFAPNTLVLREKVALQVDMLWANVMRGLTFLANDNIIEYLTEV